MSIKNNTILNNNNDNFEKKIKIQIYCAQNKKDE